MILVPSLPLPVTRPGSQWSTVSSSESFPSPTSWSSVAATKVFVKLPIRNFASQGTGVLVVRFPTPLRTLKSPSALSTPTSTPGEPNFSKASASCWAMARGVVDGGRGAASEIWGPRARPVATATVAAVASATRVLILAEVGSVRGIMVRSPLWMGVVGTLSVLFTSGRTVLPHRLPRRASPPLRRGRAGCRG